MNIIQLLYIFKRWKYQGIIWHLLNPQEVSIRLTGFLTSQGWRVWSKLPSLQTSCSSFASQTSVSLHCKSVMKGDMSTNTPRESRKSCVFRPWDLYPVTSFQLHLTQSIQIKMTHSLFPLYVIARWSSDSCVFSWASTTADQCFFMYAHVYVICLPLPGLYQEAILLCLWSSLRAVIWRLWAKVMSMGLQPAGPCIFDCNRCGLLVKTTCIWEALTQSWLWTSANSKKAAENGRNN